MTHLNFYAQFNMSLCIINKAKRFNEKAKLEQEDIAISAYHQAALIFSIMSLETIVYSIADELCIRDDFSLLEKALLLERDIVFDKGKYFLNDKLKMSKLTDKIDLLLYRFNFRFDRQKSVWWQHLKQAIKIRNELIHPKYDTTLSQNIVDNSILAVLKCADVLYRSIYHKKYPHFNKSLDSNYDF